MRKLKLTKNLADSVFVFCMALVFAVFAAALVRALVHGHPAVSFNTGAGVRHPAHSKKTILWGRLR
jgi:hypothetical protein